MAWLPYCQSTEYSRGIKALLAHPGVPPKRVHQHGVSLRSTEYGAHHGRMGAARLGDRLARGHGNANSQLCCVELLLENYAVRRLSSRLSYSRLASYGEQNMRLIFALRVPWSLRKYGSFVSSRC